MAASTPATMETPKWSTWANTTRSTKFLELHDLIVNRSLSPAHGPMTSADLNHIIKTIHKNMLRKNPNIVQDVHNYLLERNVWRYCCDRQGQHGFQCGTSTISVPRVCSNPGTSRRASCCQGSCNSSSSSSSNKCCTPPSAPPPPPPPANDGVTSSGPSKPRGKHPVSNPNIMTAEDRVKMTACENLAAATQATKK
ncbi:hypothetical protein BGAL_0396g00120 [Botrytis galanthina]|uniref:Uncharacterized protein n=1 Tax=Botrytis galanthina TaxID=278940 RepID=A0A4S8QXH5_9HELO|nr:hypothetical protein BGAL_0396g00120 [Botrytis galanthina]